MSLAYNVAVAWAALVATAVLAPAQSTLTLALVGGRLYSSPDAQPIDDATVVAEAGVIVAAGPRGSVTVPPDAFTIDCRGMFITAGFQNSHVHFTEDKWVMPPTSALMTQLTSMLTKWGVTTAVDTASLLQNTMAIRSEIETGRMAGSGPRILTAGLALYPPDGVPYYVRDVVPAEAIKLLPQPRTPAEATRIVAEQLDRGADIVKLFTGSWVARGRVVPMPVDVAAAAVAEAHRRGKLVFAHPSNLPGLEVALAAGVDVLAHAVEDTRGLTADHLRRMIQGNMALVPTLKLLAGDSNREILSEVSTFAHSGGTILFGTDVGFLTDYDPTAEYELMARAGLDWREILASMTTNPAARFGESSRRGHVAPGMDADLVVLRSDPARDVRAFADVHVTIRRGRSIFRDSR